MREMTSLELDSSSLFKADLSPLAQSDFDEVIFSDPEESPKSDVEESPKASPSRRSKCRKSPSESTRVKRHKEWYMYDGNVVIQVENTLFRLKLSTLHDHSPVFRNIVPPIQTGSLPIVGYNDRRPLVLYEVSQVDFTRLLPMLYPLEPQSPKKPHTIHDLLSILKLATNFQMDGIRNMAMVQLLELPMDPIRRIAIWEEFHLDPDLLMPSYAALCQRSEPLTLPMTMSLGIRNFTKVAAARDMYRQTVGCCSCRQSLGEDESQEIAEKIVAIVFAKQGPPLETPML